MQKITLLFLSILLFGCGTSTKTKKKLKLTFLDEYILPNDIMIDSTVVGGLSGIDYQNGVYYLVCDDSKKPRYYEATIDINEGKIANVSIQKVISIKKDTIHFLDLESILYDAKTHRVLLTSEGNIKKQKDPLFFAVDTTGSIESEFELPASFKANSPQKPRHNGTLEGLSRSSDGKGYWVAMELPLEVDGPEPQLVKTTSPVRLTYIDKSSKQPKRQVAYLLDSIVKKPKNNFAVNGLTDILEYKKELFFIIERSYSSGLGTQGNTVKIFNVDVSKATNTLAIDNLKNTNYTLVTKELLFDFEQIRSQLTDHSVDNIEGITFGPTLSNGNKTLLLISDNNFSKFEKQFNQFILFEIVD